MPGATKVQDIMCRTPVIVDSGMTVGEAYRLMAKRAISHLIITKNNKLVGIVSEKDFLFKLATKTTWNVDIGSFHLSSFLSGTPVTTTPQEDVRSAVSLMLDQSIGILPVIEEGRIVGAVTKQDTLKAVPPSFRSVKIGEIMTSSPIMVFKYDKARDVRAKIVENLISLVPVMEDIKPIGIVDDFTLFEAFLKLYKIVPPRHRRARLDRLVALDVLKRSFDALPPSATVDEAIRLFVERGSKGVLVVQDDVLLGILTKTDILEAAFVT